jgi:hypothetical protein
MNHEENIVFETVHGSILYGMNHANSDRDRMVVYNDNRKARHYHVGEDDCIRVGWIDLIDKAASGSHQFIEGLFSQEKVWTDERYKPLIEGMVIPVALVREKYTRTIHKFSHGPFKQRRHALRLAKSLLGLRQTGYFNPRLSADDVEWFTELANKYEGEELYIRALALASEPGAQWPDPERDE